MGALSGAVQWWDESQLRFLVLASLGIQYFLTFFAGGRKYSVPSWFRFVIWLSYLGSDALAIYALATLFNRRGKRPSSNGGRDLEVLWAPFLLMHLGGQIFITAYNIEDNELWRRHIVTALSQVAVALYVFCKSWSLSADDKLLAAAILVFIPGILKCFGKPWGLKWPETVSQRSILGQFAHNKRHNKLMSFATRLRCNDLLDQHWSMESCHSAKNITKLVRIHVQQGWKAYITDAESYLEFNDIRGQWTLEHEGCHGRLNWSLEKPFDESILLWHIATDLCFHLASTSPASSQPCREMSNYMMHLLVANPEMLITGSRRSLFTIAYKELEAILKEDQDDALMEESKIAKQVIYKVKSAQDTSTKESFIYDAWVLAQGLIDLGDKKMWDVIQGVWLEMMCFSAGRCRGFLHAKALGSGGEYLSYVWLTLAYSGMETFPERLQRTKKLNFSAERRKHLRTGGHDIPSPSANSHSTEEEITAAPPASQGDCTVEIVVSPKQ
ncbi:hypothetical protein ACQ4PT_050023 [Festuca glaucescens]